MSDASLMPGKPSRRLGLIPPVIVFLAAAAAYVQTLSYGFVNWDDYKLIVENPYIRGLSRANLSHIWTRPIQETYLPLRATSYAVDYAFWALNPMGFHLTNVILNALAALLVYLVVKRLSASWPAALVAGLVFALHPVHTEPVAWASGRKDLLSTALFLAAYLAYLASREEAGRPSRRWALLAASLAAFVLSGLAKAMVVTLPALVVVTDLIYPRPQGEGRWSLRSGLTAIYIPWALYFAASALLIWIAVHFASSAGAIRPYHFGGAGRTAAFMTWVALYYIKTLLYPTLLSARYPFGDTASFGVPSAIVYLSPVLLAAALAAAGRLFWRATLSRAAKSPALRLAALGAAWFFVTILPVMNIIPINVLVADRYLYLPSMGLALMAGALFLALWREGLPFEQMGFRRIAAIVLAAALVASYAARTATRNPVWRDSLSLWTSVAREFPESSQARLQLAAAYADADPPDYAAAMLEAVRAQAIDAASGEPHLLRGKILSRTGRHDSAVKAFQEARRLGLPGRAEIYDSYMSEAAALEGQGMYLSAASAYGKAIEVDPARPEGYNNLGRVYQMAGDAARAERLFGEAISRDERFAPAWYNRAVLAYAKRDTRGAELYYIEALKSNPAYPEALTNLAAIYIDTARPSKAIQLLTTAVSMKPDLVPAWANLGRAYAAVGDTEAARAAYDKALALSPGNAALLKALEELK